MKALPYGPPNYEYKAILGLDINSDLRSELLRFLLTLELWQTTPGQKEIRPEQVWISSLTRGPEFAKELDDFFALSWREREIESYNFSFPAKFLPRFSEETDDISYALQEPSPADKGTLISFEQHLDEILDEVPWEEIVLPSDGEILFEKSTTTSYIHKTKRKVPQWEASLLYEEFNEKELVGLRCVVPVFPAGIRDTIIADITANNSIRWLERAMRHILQYIPESADCLHSSTFLKRREDVVYQVGHHVLRDIKKCGLTYNVRELFPIVKEKLLERINDRRWNRMNIYSRLIIIDDDAEFEAKRGYGLGMANHLVTLCNIVIHRMARGTIGDCNVKCKAIFGNDDADVVFFGPDASRISKCYMDSESDIHEHLGNMINRKKSCIKPYGLFYEEYNKPGWKHKESLVCNALACAYLAPNIRVAKHYVYSQSDRFNSPWAIDQLKRVVSFWGAQYFTPEDELYVHYECGGWLNFCKSGLKTTLEDIDFLSSRHSVLTISKACIESRNFIKGPSPIKKREEFVDNFRYKGPSKKTEPRVQLYFLGPEDLKEYYKKLTTFQRNYSKRIARFDDGTYFKLLKKSIRQIQKLFLREAPWYTIPDSLVQEEDRRIRWRVEAPFASEMEWPIKANYLEEMILSYINNSEVNAYNRVWDPQVPPQLLGLHMGADITSIYSNSQFSNTGVLPTYEYWKRTGKCPITIQVGRLNFMEPIPDRSHIPFRSSLWKSKPKRRDKPRIPEPDTFWDDGIQQIELHEDILTFINMPVEEIIPQPHLEFKIRDDKIEDFFDRMTDTTARLDLDIDTYFQRTDEPESDHSSVDFEGAFDMF